ncbi:hypothetical protein KQI65_02240 [bacterium]|nr:hypothetical protein [bacterium]
MRYDLSTSVLRVRDLYRIGYDILRRNAQHMLLMFFVTVLPGAALKTGLDGYFGFDPVTLENFQYGMLSTLIAMLFTIVNAIYLMRLTAEDVRENPVRVDELFKVTVRLYVPVAIAYLIIFLGLMLGLVLFVLPGIVFMVYMGFFATFMVIDGAGVFESMSKSARLVQGHFFHVVGISLAIFLPFLIVSMILETMAVTPLARFLVMLITEPMNFIVLIMGTVFYMNVRIHWKEVPPEAEAAPVTESREA